MNALVAFGAALLAFRLAGLLARRWRASRRPELAAWAWVLAAYAVAAGAIAWGEAAQWDGRAFRVYYASGALLTAPLLGAGSLLFAGVRRAAAVGLLYAGLAIGVAIAMPVHGLFAAHGLPAAQDHLAFVPARLLAILANSLGTLAVVAIARTLAAPASAGQHLDRARRRSGGDRQRPRRPRRRRRGPRNRARRSVALRRVQRALGATTVTVRFCSAAEIRPPRTAGHNLHKLLK